MAVASRIEAMENRIHFATYLLSDYFPTEEGLTLQFSGYSYDYYQGEAATFPSAQLTYVYNWVSFEGERVLQELEREQVQYQAEDVERAYMRLDSTGVWELGVLNEDGLTCSVSTLLA
jgi:hypothetical protein